MTTQQTFEDLVGRVSVATDKLETAVTAVEQGTGEITVLVERAEQAEAGAIAASEIANEAAVDAVAAKDVILNTPLLPEAPVDGKTYGRNNAAWVEVISGGGGGSGSVNSVNEITPDAQGNITLTPSDIGAAEAVHTHANATTTEAGFMSATDKTKLDGIATGATVGADWNTNVANKPTIPTQGITSIQAGDNITIDNTNPLSPIISASGGGSSGGFPISGDFYYDSVAITEWPSLNPNDAIDLNKCGAWLRGRWKSGGELLTAKAGLNILPSGNYFFSSIDSAVTNIVGSGVVVVTNSSNTDKTVKVVTLGGATTLPQEYYPVIASNDSVTWELTTEDSSGGDTGGWPFPNPTQQTYWEYEVSTGVWEPMDSWPTNNPFLAVPMSKMRRNPPSGLPNTGTGAIPNWNQMFSLTSYTRRIPPGMYQFVPDNFPTGPLAGLGSGVIHVISNTASASNTIRIWAEIRDSVTGKVTIYDHFAGNSASEYKWTKRVTT